jgi:hypothetical protein
VRTEAEPARHLARGMSDMLEALDRKRGKRPQVVRVERVVVHDGGQAVVGNVSQAPRAALSVPALEAEPAGPTLNLSKTEPALASCEGRGQA